MIDPMNPSAEPPLWEIEFRVPRVIAEQCGIDLGQIRNESRLVEDLHIDSLDLVELVLALEEAFDVTFPDDVSRLPFITGSVTVGDLARIVRHQWGSGAAERTGWCATKRAPKPALTTPFTQLGGMASEKARQAGPLHEAIAQGETGCAQFRRRTDGMRCVLLPDAEVDIGSDDPTALTDQQPRHSAEISAFLMDAEPVSTTAYARFLNSINASSDAVPAWCGVTTNDRRGRHFQLERHHGFWRPRDGTEHQPMVLVSWFGANAYSLWAHRENWNLAGGEHADRPGFLPTEAQWEYAARGPRWQRFPWGDEPCTRDRALVDLHTARQEYPGLLPLAGVTEKLGVSPFGLLHMAGNVWHWCRDWYDPHFYASPRATCDDPVNTEPTRIRSERGGSWIGPAELAVSSYRRGRPPTARGRCLGFRCAIPASLCGEPDICALALELGVGWQ